VAEAGAGDKPKYGQSLLSGALLCWVEASSGRSGGSLGSLKLGGGVGRVHETRRRVFLASGLLGVAARVAWSMEPD
jgi:hypothetical protein